MISPVVVLLAVGGGGLEPSLRLFAPVSVYALPAVVMVAFWWEDWPGTKFRPGVSAATDVALIAALAVAFTVGGQLAAGGIHLRGVFSTGALPGPVAAFPTVIPLGGAWFIAMLQISIVGEGWPLRRLGPISGGVSALLLSLVLGLAVYYSLLGFWPAAVNDLNHHGVVSEAQFGALLLQIGAWQVTLFLLGRGAAFASIHSRGRRLATTHLTVIGGGCTTYLLLVEQLRVDPSSLNAVTSCVMAAAFVGALVFEGWPFAHRARFSGLMTGVALTPIAAALYGVLELGARRATWTTAGPDAWIGYAAGNALGLAAILHVAVTRRWPLTTANDSQDIGASLGLPPGPQPRDAPRWPRPSHRRATSPFDHDRPEMR